MLEKGVYAKAKFGKLWHRLWKMDCCGFRQVWRREAPTKGVQGACPRQAGDPCCRNGASEASPRAEGTGRKLVFHSATTDYLIMYPNSYQHYHITSVFD